MSCPEKKNEGIEIPLEHLLKALCSSKSLRCKLTTVLSFYFIWLIKYADLTVSTQFLWFVYCLFV